MMRDCMSIDPSYFTRSQKCTYAIEIPKNATVTAIQMASCIIDLHQSLRPQLPGTFLLSPPPDQAERRGALIFLENTLNIRQERWLIREVTTPLVTHEKPIGDL